MFARLDLRFGYRPGGASGRWQAYVESLNVLKHNNAWFMDADIVDRGSVSASCRKNPPEVSPAWYVRPAFQVPLAGWRLGAGGWSLEEQYSFPDPRPQTPESRPQFPDPSCRNLTEAWEMSIDSRGWPGAFAAHGAPRASTGPSADSCRALDRVRDTVRDDGQGARGHRRSADRR